MITTVVGNGLSGFSGDGGPAADAQLARPGGIAADSAGNLFIADTYNQRIRKVSSDGIITTLVNSRVSNPDCLASLAPLMVPGFNFGYCTSSAVAVDRKGNLFFNEIGFDDFLDVTTYSARLRKLSSDGIITTVAGMARKPTPVMARVPQTRKSYLGRGQWTEPAQCSSANRPISVRYSQTGSSAPWQVMVDSTLTPLMRYRPPAGI